MLVKPVIMILYKFIIRAVHTWWKHISLNCVLFRCCNSTTNTPYPCEWTYNAFYAQIIIDNFLFYHCQHCCNIHYVIVTTAYLPVSSWAASSCMSWHNTYHTCLMNTESEKRSKLEIIFIIHEAKRITQNWSICLLSSVLFFIYSIPRRRTYDDIGIDDRSLLH